MIFLLLPSSQIDSSNSQIHTELGYTFVGYNPRIRSSHTFCKQIYILKSRPSTKPV